MKTSLDAYEEEVERLADEGVEKLEAEMREIAGEKGKLHADIDRLAARLELVMAARDKAKQKLNK